ASRVRPANAECHEFIDHEQFVELARAARAVVTHAGVGSLLTVREAGRRPIVVPRRKACGEAVDDHQVSFSRRRDELGLATLVEDVDLLPSMIVNLPQLSVDAAGQRRALESTLRAYIQQVADRQPVLSTARSLV